MKRDWLFTVLKGAVALIDLIPTGIMAWGTAHLSLPAFCTGFIFQCAMRREDKKMQQSCGFCDTGVPCPRHGTIVP